jgi:hypothetical protein
MANEIYPKYLIALATGQFNMLTDDIRIVLLDLDGATPYVYAGTHEFLSDIPVGARIATSSDVTGKTFGTVGVGVWDHDDTTILSVPAGEDIEAFACYKHTGTDATSRLICYVDRQPDNTTPLALTPDGGNVLVTVPAGGRFTI